MPLPDRLVIHSIKTLAFVNFADHSFQPNENEIAQSDWLKSKLSRPAVILFQNGLPKKSHCVCPVGASGLCCHTLALLLYLKHFSETGEKILELTCTQQLQQWHRKAGKGSIPMVPLKEIKLKSAKAKVKMVK